LFVPPPSRARNPERDLADDAYEGGDLVFCEALGWPIPPKVLGRPSGPARKAAGIATGTLHILCATGRRRSR